MTKWTDYCISVVKYASTGNHIDRVRVQVDSDTGVEPGKQYRMNMQRLKRSIIAVCFLGLTSSATYAAPTYDADGALANFNARTFLSGNDVTNLTTAINTVIGNYLVIQNGVLTPVGKGKVITASPNQVDLKDGQVYHAWINSSDEVDASLLNFFNFKVTKDSLNELQITDVITVTDPAVKGDFCISNRPLFIDATVKYWCVTAVTLTKISTNVYIKAKKLLKGTYGIASADGNFLRGNGQTSTRFEANVSVIGPFMNGKLTSPDAVPVLPLPTSPTPKLVPKKLNGEKLTGLEGMNFQSK